MNKDDKEHLQHNLIAMADSYPEGLINQLCQVVMDYDRVRNDDNNKLIEARRFDDSHGVINEILLFLMSQSYAIIGVVLDEDAEAYDVKLYRTDYREFDNDKSKPHLSPWRHYAVIQIESEGATVYIYERPA
jgi:hypothetical protein